MKPVFNKRNIILIALTLLVLGVKFATDPTAGAVTTEFLIYVSTPILVVLIGHWLRKILFPYIDMGDLYDKAIKSPIGSGLVFIGMCLVVFGIYGLFGPSARAQDVTTYIPAQARVHLPVLVAEQERLWPDHPKRTSLVV
jgi:hypothetical protein